MGRGASPCSKMQASAGLRGRQHRRALLSDLQLETYQPVLTRPATDTSVSTATFGKCVGKTTRVKRRKSPMGQRKTRRSTPGGSSSPVGAAGELNISLLSITQSPVRRPSRPPSQRQNARKNRPSSRGRHRRRARRAGLRSMRPTSPRPHGRDRRVISSTSIY